MTIALLLIVIGLQLFAWYQSARVAQVLEEQHALYFSKVAERIDELAVHVGRAYRTGGRAE